MNVLRPPYIKPKGFCPNPIAKYGIPKEADSILNPKVIDTRVYQEYWEEQLSYILNGYETGGMKIPGRYYYYLNFSLFDTVKGVIPPLICDLHLEVAHIIDYCKKNGKNGLFPKKRRGGLSEAFNIMTLDYGWRFHIGYKGGVAASQEAYVQDFMLKWHNFNRRIVPEFRIQLLADNDNEKIAGWEEKTETGFITMGTGNTIVQRTMFKNPALFKGLYLNDILTEEVGEFELFKKYIEASKHCLMFGDKQVGNLWGWGTGDADSKGSDVFEWAWHNAEYLNFERFFISDGRFHFPYFGGAEENGINVEITPNLQHLTPEERIGVEDIQAAEEAIDKKLSELLASGDVEGYRKEKQNMPRTVQDVFAGTISEIFDHEILNDTGYKLASEPPKYTKYKLEPKKNELGEIILPYKIELIPAKDTDEEKDCVLIADDCKYLENSSKLYAGGIDSYLLDKAKTTNSLGGMCVLVRDNDIPNYPKNKVAAVIRCRPERKEVFFDMCIYLAAYYNLIGATLIDTGQGEGLFEHFKNNHARKFLAKRPLSAEKDDSQQTHEYGLKLTKYSKKYMEGIMQSYVKSHGRTIPFIKLIDELKVYKEQQIDSDNDLADAFGIALVQSIEMGSKPRSKKEVDDRKKRLSVNHDIFSQQTPRPTKVPITKDWGVY